MAHRDPPDRPPPPLTKRRKPIRTVVERGPKEKKVVAFAVDWPGWSRGAKTAEAALETLEAYRERYRPVAHAAGFGDELDAAGSLEVVEENTGPGSTDFWAISFRPSDLETEPMGEEQLERKLAILQACWAYFDEVAARVSPELQRGPRGGGRDRDQIVGHILRTERSQMAPRVGVKRPEGGDPTVDDLRDHRADYLDALRAYEAGELRRFRGTWNLPFLVRHTAFHTMDHAWELEDKDLSVAPPFA